MRRGNAIVWFGWQEDVLPGDGRMLLEVPVARNRNAAVTGLVRTEFVADRCGVKSFPQAREAVEIPEPAGSSPTKKKGIGLDGQGEERAIVASDQHVYLPEMESNQVGFTSLSTRVTIY